MRRALPAALLLALAAATTGSCSSRAEPDANITRSPSPSTSTSTIPSSVPSPSQSPSGSTAAALDTEQTFADTSTGVTVKITAMSYRVITLGSQNQELAKAGTKVALVQARMCVTADKSGTGVGLTWRPWSVLTSAGAAYTPLSAHGTQDWPGALYPNDASATYHAGTCRSGLIPFMFTGPDEPVTVEYNAHGGVYDWRLS